MIDWQTLASMLATELRLPAAETRITPLAGGDINRAGVLECGGRQFFVKFNRPERKAMFDAERLGLEAIRDSGAIRAPRVFLTGSDSRCAYIVMEYIEMSAAADSARMAQALAAMHGCVQPEFGFRCDNTIGSTPQSNRWTRDWVEFWREQRLGLQLELARRNGLAAETIDAGLRLSQRLPQFFSHYRPQASLLHGDLWSGNQGADASGEPVIYDPACYFGDHEADLAMMELFGSPGERFFAVYNEHFPIDADYGLRRDLYNLYHVLNHANLFGGGYAAQARRMTERLLAKLR